MESVQIAATEPPSPARGAEASFPARAYSYGTQGYWTLIRALFEGLRAYELRQGGGDHAPAPLPAA